MVKVHIHDLIILCTTMLLALSIYQNCRLMQGLELPYLILPVEFCQLLKLDDSSGVPTNLAFDLIRSNKMLYQRLEELVANFDDGRGFEKTILGLGWDKLRDQIANVYIQKFLNFKNPRKNDKTLTDDIKQFEALFQNHEKDGTSRIFLLGFYLKMANLKGRRRSSSFVEIEIPDEVVVLLRLSQLKSDKLDWLILILTHLIHGFGYQSLLSLIASGKKMDDLYEALSASSRKTMSNNLLAYAMSINEPEFFLYQKI